MKIALNNVAEKAPAGKRSVRETIYGNTNAYIGRKFWRTIGTTYSAQTDRDVAAFLAGEID